MYKSLILKQKKRKFQYKYHKIKQKKKTLKGGKICKEKEKIEKSQDIKSFIKERTLKNKI